MEFIVIDRDKTTKIERPLGLNIDCIYNESNIDTIARMPDNFIDLVVTSPPYDGLRQYNGYCFDFESLAKGLYRVMKPGGTNVYAERSQARRESVKDKETRCCCSRIEAVEPVEPERDIR